MHKSFGEVVDLRPQTFQQQLVPAVTPKRLPGLHPWLRFGPFFTCDDWIASFGIDLESIGEKAANAYLEDEAAFFEPLLEDYVPALGKDRVLDDQAAEARNASTPVYPRGDQTLRKSNRAAYARWPSVDQIRLQKDVSRDLGPDITLRKTAD